MGSTAGHNIGVQGAGWCARGARTGCEADDAGMGYGCTDAQRAGRVGWFRRLGWKMRAGRANKLLRENWIS